MRTLKTAIKTNHYRMIRKEYDDSSILEFWFPGRDNGKMREIKVIKDPKGVWKVLKRK
jgi:hypothetical protein